MQLSGDQYWWDGFRGSKYCVVGFGYEVLLRWNAKAVEWCGDWGLVDGMVNGGRFWVGVGMVVCSGPDVVE